MSAAWTGEVARVAHGIRLRAARACIDDTWTHAGSRDDPFATYRLDADAIIDAAETARGRPILERSTTADADGAQRDHTAVAEDL